MNYVIFVLAVAFFIFCSVYVYNESILKGKDNLKISFVFLLCSMVIGMCIFLITFISFKFLNWILPVNIPNYKILILSFTSIFIILFGESIIKLLLSTIVGSYFNKKYKNKSLSENEIIELIQNKHLIIEILKVSSMFLISYSACLVITYVLNIENNYIISTFESIINSIIYIFMFKSKYSRENSSTKILTSKNR